MIVLEALLEHNESIATMHDVLYYRKHPSDPGAHPF